MNKTGSAVAVYDCEQNDDTSKHWVFAGPIASQSLQSTCHGDGNHSAVIYDNASVAKWLRAWDILTMFEATVCGRS